MRLTDLTKFQELNLAVMHDLTFAVHDYLYGKASPCVRICCEYVMSHLHDRITLNTLAEISHRTPHYVSDLFQKELGIRPTEFIRKKKLEYAENILISTDLSVTEISDLLAFPGPSAFIQYFKAMYGVTPGEYRTTSLPSY